MTPVLALTWVERILAVAVVLQSVELIQMRKEAYSSDGVWSWSVLRAEYLGYPRPLLKAFDWLMDESGFTSILIARIILALSLFWFPHFVTALLLLLATTLVCVRWRGSFNGGSDYMTMVILTGVCVARAGNEPRKLIEAGLAYIAIQLCLSYFIAGVVKLKVQDWRSGSALVRLMEAGAYGIPRSAREFASKPGVAFTAAWGVMFFEILFPLSLLGSGFAAIFLGAGIFFHLVNYYFLGLNRFVFAWTAAYPALLFLSQVLRANGGNP